jgi:hypothetical protein
MKVTYLTGAQAEGLEAASADEVSQIFQIRFVQKGHELCHTNVLEQADSYVADRPYILGSGALDIVASEFFVNPRAADCPTTFTLKEVASDGTATVYAGDDLTAISTTVPSFTITSDKDSYRPRTVTQFRLTVTDTWSSALEFDMNISFEDACADALFLAGSKKAVDDVNVILGEDGKTVTPFFELSVDACTPTMVVRTTEDLNVAYAAYDAAEGSDYITSVAADSLVVASSSTDSLEKTIYYQVAFTIEGAVGASTEGEAMLTYEFAVNYLH